MDKFKYLVLVQTPRTLTKRFSKFTATIPHLYLSMFLLYTKSAPLSGEQRGQKQKVGNLSTSGTEVIFRCYSLMATMASKYKPAIIVDASLCSANSSVLT